MTKKTKKVRASDECKNPDCRKMHKALSRLTKASIGKPAKQLWFDEKWLAIRLGLPQKAVQKMRYKREGPQPEYIGTRVRYHIREIRAYERSLSDPSAPYIWR